MTSIQKYGKQFESLKKRQLSLTQCIGKDKTVLINARMSGIYRDIVEAEASYHSLLGCLGAMKKESHGKELELMTKDKQHIKFLENEKLVQSSYLEDYMKKNQVLQTQLIDCEMKLRQTQNKLNRVIQQKSKSKTMNKDNYENYAIENYASQTNVYQNRPELGNYHAG